MRGNQNARQGIERKQSYKELEDENELLRDSLDSAEQVLNEIRALLI